MKHITRLFLFSCLAATIACGSQSTGNMAPQEDATLEEQTQDQIFRVIGEETSVEVLDVNGDAKKISLHNEDHIVVIGDEKTIGDGQTWVSVAIDTNGSESEVVYMRPQDIFELPLALMTIDNDSDWAGGEDLDLPQSLNVIIGGYEKSMPTLRVSRMTYCYRYVKKYLLKVGLVKVYLPGVSAYMAAKILPKHGFKKVARKPSQAITHDVCVYKGGPSGHGHIEIKRPQGWYYGYGFKKSPIKNRILLGCFHK